MNQRILPVVVVLAIAAVFTFASSADPTPEPAPFQSDDACERILDLCDEVCDLAGCDLAGGMDDGACAAASDVCEALAGLCEELTGEACELSCDGAPCCPPSGCCGDDG